MANETVMKKYIIILIALIALIGCSNTYDLQGAYLGEDKGDFVVSLYNKAEITNEDNNTLTYSGHIPLFGMLWNKGIFTFDNNDKLVKLYVLRPLSTSSDSSIENIKSILREYCGESYVDFKSKTVTYGSDGEKDCQGSLMVNTTDDALFVGIELRK